MIYLYAFLVGGFICFLGQLLIELFKLTPGYITCLFVSIGCFLEFFDIYDKLVKFAGAGALLPITSFGHSLAHGAIEGLKENGFFGIITGMYKNTSSGIAAAIIIAMMIGIIFKPKG